MRKSQLININKCICTLFSKQWLGGVNAFLYVADGRSLSPTSVDHFLCFSQSSLCVHGYTDFIVKPVLLWFQQGQNFRLGRGALLKRVKGLVRGKVELSSKSGIGLVLGLWLSLNIQSERGVSEKCQTKTVPALLLCHRRSIANGPSMRVGLESILTSCK